MLRRCEKCSRTFEVSEGGREILCVGCDPKLNPVLRDLKIPIALEPGKDVTVFVAQEGEVDREYRFVNVQEDTTVGTLAGLLAARTGRLIAHGQQFAFDAPGGAVYPPDARALELPHGLHVRLVEFEEWDEDADARGGPEKAAPQPKAPRVTISDLRTAHLAVVARAAQLASQVSYLEDLFERFERQEAESE